MVVFAWVGARVAMLWPSAGSLPAAIQAALPIARAEPHLSAPVAVRSRVAAATRRGVPMQVSPVYRLPLGDDDPRVQLALMGLVQYGEPGWAPLFSTDYSALPARAVPSPERLDPLPDRWSLSSWIVVRGSGGAAAAPGGQIGGGQAGVRAAWLLAPRQRLAAYGRLTAPLQGKGREAALGLEWQPTRVPVRLIAERRFGLDGNPGGTGLGAITGVDIESRGFRLEAYGQAGVVLRRRADPYADGAARGVRMVAASGPVRLGLGAGAWGAAQRDAQRLDLGPSATLAVRNLRLALDWRQRVAGEARPGSGLALTLGADF
ncbi:hypothetical protein [Sphingomonas sp. R-74633]|uniref:hypothetical protein n=1 Tax=Sphingomonas sp. R-74633 TaxID=2751188 RepID=UPI00211DC556|nr:hypothetical protein [Sphingomonas sp. R-74633]